MADEIGTSGKLYGLLPADHMKESGGEAPGQENLLRGKKKRRKEKPPAEMDQEEELLDPTDDPASGKILDIVI
ncbi:MAG: hypothetical protein FJ110_06405 [Deltaproteobacteria bacterium]|nr:hypothetical protein [Deltaproteobacteria bacterium]